ncbi:hypothetical protein DICPUDRAFT_156386 [Dictyostelium purpureum]|uniref:Clathrin light chain n=1 Tax=Dictyostelium purpureum TaxID=5786 RepID=F0ZWF8_DICPU|nr:uncharacterized protein DICPUDRAFT_156386 [Dictyostelium purpureum]EGC31724.1 hypothetical protein DICPUDRAFT_156386 [Dictyostelium purpureum]|eukprot:XP_003291758.1 hypothetical protein DICPUDRAFT_156386 [Dictyostelium purpureum]
MSDPFGDENIEYTEEFVEGDINEADLVDEHVEYIDENGVSLNSFNNNSNSNTLDFETEDVSNKNNNNNNDYSNDNSSFSAGASHLSPSNRETAPAMKEYLAKHEKELEDKQKASEEKRKKKIAEAKQSLDNFYSEREAKKKTALKNNREHNKTLEGEGTTGGEHSWESVVSMIDLQAKPTPTNKDTSRMKEILLRLKNQPIA